MKLLIVSTVSATIRAFLFPYADHFRSAGWEVDAMASGIEACFDCSKHFDKLFSIQWSRTPLDLHNLIGPASRVRDVVISGNYDIIHVHTPVAAFISRVALALPFAGKRPVLIYTAHGFHFQSGNNWVRNLVFASLEKLAGRWTDHLITINTEDTSAVLRLGIVPPDRLHYAPGIGIDPDFFCRRAVSPGQIARVRHRFGILLNTPVFVTVGELIPRKRHRDIISALARMNRKDAHLIFVGEGGERENLRRLSAELGVLSRLHLVGSSEDVRPFILTARAMILPSTQEGLPRSIMESFACGIPVVASDIRGSRDLLAEGGGMLFPSMDVQALASRMDWFCSNPDQAANMGAAAQVLVKQYGIANLLKFHEQLYMEIMQSRAELRGAVLPRNGHASANAGLQSKAKMWVSPFAGK